MGSHQLRRSVSIRPAFYIVVRKLAARHQESMSSAVERLIAAAAAEAGIEALPEEVQAINASRITGTLAKEQLDHDRWAEARAKLDRAFG